MSATGSHSELSSRDRSILTALSRSVRVLSLDQVAKTWWSAGLEASATQRAKARARLRQLELDGHLWLSERVATIEHLPPAPLAAWQRGLPRPDLESVSQLACKRFSAPVRAVTCVVASKQSGVWLSGKGGDESAASELSHDLLLGEVFLYMMRALPTRARLWRGEAVLPHQQGAKIPDAVVRDGAHRTAVELVGQYSAKKLNSFHDYCAKNRLAYELW